MTPNPAAPPTNPFSVPPNPASASIGFIESDIACRRCGYNLRGLREEMACPECGTAVGLSTRGDFLRYADPNWVETIGRGTSLILWGILATLIAACAGAGIEAAGGGAPLAGVIGLLAGLISVAGVWLLTARDPGHLGEDRYARARRFTRIALLCGLGGGALRVLLDLPGIPRELGISIGLLMGLLLLVSVFGEYFKFLYIEHLATRVPDDFLTRRARFLRFGIVITLGVATLFALLGGLLATVGGNTRTASGPITGFAGLSGAAGIALVIAGIGFALYGILGLVSILFLLRFSKRLREQAQNARLTWAAQAAGGRAV